MADLGGRFVRWLLLDGNRHAVALTLLALVFSLLAGLGSVGAVALDDPDAVRGVAGGLIPGLFTFLSIVLAINQLVLSQEFGSADEIRERVEDIRAFRRDVEEVADEAPSPVLPTAFVSLVLQAVGSEAAALRVDPSEGLEPGVAEEVTDYARTVAAEADRASDVLERSEPGRVNAVLSVLEFEDARYLYDARRLRHDHGEALPDETYRALDGLTDALELFGVARTHFRTSYTQRVLARLSRLLLYVGVPALLIAAVLAMRPSTFDPIGAGPLGILVTSALLAIALSPLAVLFAYILRIATVSERTIAVGPFVSRPGGDDRASTPGTGSPVVDAPADEARSDESGEVTRR